jgi:protein phosphatase
MNLRLETASHTHPGKIRKVNEDAVFSFVRPPEKGEIQGLLIVADGIGGHKAGDIASKLAVETIYESLEWFLNKDQSEDTTPIKRKSNLLQPYTESSTHLELRLMQAIQQANQKVFDYAQNHPEEASNMGTTITCALIRGKNLVIAHVGDSRAYRLRNYELHQLTEDHSFVGQLVRTGQLPVEAYYVHPRRNVITRALGQFPNVQIDLRTDSLEVGDKFLLCSDGLWEMVRDPLMKNYLEDAEDLEQTVQDLVKEAISQGGPDNISVIISEVIVEKNGS